jgi:predicted phosphodiesterase
MRIAVFADIHGNLPALDAVLADMDAAGDFDLVWCLGDLAALGGQPQECVQRLLLLREAHGEAAVKIIGGNTDRYLVTGERMPAKAADTPEALEAFRKTASIRPRDPEVRFFLGMAHLTLGNREAARQEYETLKRLGAHRQAETLKQQMNRPEPGN